MTRKRRPVNHFPMARDVAASTETAPVDSPAPANGTVGASASLDDASDGKLVEVAHSRSDSKPIAIRSDHEHRLLSLFIAHLLGQGAGFFSSPVPISGMVEIRCSGHGTHPFSSDSEHPNAESGMWFLFQPNLANASKRHWTNDDPIAGAARKIAMRDGPSPEEDEKQR